MADFILISFSLIQFIIVSFICYYEAQRKSPVVFLWATLVIMFGVMHLVTVLGSNLQYSGDTMLEASLFVIGFCINYMLIRTTIKIKMGNFLNITEEIGKESIYKKYNCVLIILLFVSTVFSSYSITSFAGGFVNTSWGEMREYSLSLGYANSSQILSILYFSTSGVLLLNLFTKKKKEAILCTLCILTFTIITRNRILILPLLVNIILFKLYPINKIKIKNILLASLAAAIVIYLVYGIRVFRHYGSIELFISNFNISEFINTINYYLTTDNGELGLRNDFYYFIDNDNKFYGFGTCASYIRMILVYLPTQFSFGLKPDDFAITMGQAIGMAEGGSTHPTLFGDCYANLGFLGIFLGMFWALYAVILDVILIKTNCITLKVLLYSLFSVTFVIIGRGSVYNSFFFVAWGVPLLYIIDFLMRKLLGFKVRIKG